MKRKGNMLDPSNILKSLYNEVYDIASYVAMLQTKYDCNLAVFHDGDPEMYSRFFSRLLVCLHTDDVPPFTPPSFVQFSSQREIVARVIQRICEKKKRNVLSFGYGLVHEDSLSHVKYASNICSFSPNPTTATVSTSILWETLLTRVGDDVMMHLLENCSLFVLVPPSCCYQVCGQPIYNLSNANCIPMSQNNIFHYVQKKASHFRKCSFKTNCRKRKLSKKSANVIKGHVEHKNRQRKGKCMITSRITHPNKRRSPLEMKTQTRQTKRQRMEDICNVSRKRLKTLHEDNPMTALHFVKQDLKAADLVQEDLPHLKLYRSFDSCSNFQTACMHESNQQVPSKDLNVCNGKSLKPVSSPQSKVSPSKILIDLGALLYCSRVYKEGFPDNFMLNTLESSSSGSQKLVRAIFISNSLLESHYDHPYSAEKTAKKLPKRYWQMRDVFRELIKNHKKCPYMALLKKHCPVGFTDVCSYKNKVVKEDINVKELSESSTKQLYNIEMTDAKQFTCRHECNKEHKESNATSFSPETITESHDSPCEPLSEMKTIKDECLLTLLKQHSSVWQVYMFVRDCLHKVIPGALWGSSHNKCCFLRNVKNVIYSVKFDKISLSELMWKMRVEDCIWIRLLKSTCYVPVSEHALREQTLAKFIFWLMDTYIIQLLKSFFYITETLFQKNKLFFYRKEFWKRIENIGLRKHLENVELRLMSSQEIQGIEQQNNVTLISTLRFVPKSGGLRPIAKMCNTLGAQQRKESRDKKIQHFSSRMRNLFSVLNYERSKMSTIVGASVFGLDDIYKKWKKFVLEFQESKDENVKFYFVKADVKGAYDTIPHSKLKEVVSKMIKGSIEEHYCIRRYATVWMDSDGQLRKSFKQHVSTMVDFFPDISQFASHLQDCGIMQNAILVEQSLALNENSEELLRFFEQICNHILRIKNNYYMQCCGIPQGSMLSSLLCSLCYGDMENRFFRGMEENGILMRLIDDFLLVTPHLEHAKIFLRMLAKGIPQYGCSLSPHKTAANFPIDNIPECSQVKEFPAHCLFQWCGLLFDTRTLEVYCDYSNYARTSIRSSLTFCHSNSAGKSMRQKLIRILRLKCHCLLLDLKVNRQRTVFINVYKIFLLQAYRFHACVLQLPFRQGVKNNPAFFLNVISEMAPCLYSILKRSNKDLSIGFKDAGGPIPFEAVQWLNYQAFTVKLNSHKAMYKCLLVPLKKCAAWLSGKLPNKTLYLLRAVTNGSLHKDFSTVIS